MEFERDDERLVVTVSNSVFCRTATPSGEGLACVYYSAFFNGLLDCTSEDYASFEESSCRARGDLICQFEAVSKEVGSQKEEVDVEATSVA
jgi:predicted hydrocarbon binding protein